MVRTKRKVKEKAVTAATWTRVLAAVAEYDALPPEIRRYSIHHEQIKKIRNAQGA